MTLWDSYEQSLKNGTGVKCKKKDVMNLRAITFKSKRDTLIDGFIEAARFLVKQGVYAPDNLPYNTQFIPNRSLEKVSCHFLMTAIRKTALYMLDL